MALTPNELKQADDIVFAVVDDLIDRMKDVRHEHEVEFVHTLTAGQQMVWTAFVIVDGQVSNGGFNQLFWNSSRLFVESACNGYRLIGADEHVRLLEEAIRRHGVDSERIQPYVKENTLEAFSASYSEGIFDDLDNQFFALDSYALVEKYIRENMNDFAGAPEAAAPIGVVRASWFRRLFGDRLHRRSRGRGSRTL